MNNGNAPQMQNISRYLQPVENRSGTAWKTGTSGPAPLPRAGLEKWDAKWKKEMGSMEYGPVRRVAEENFRERFAAWVEEHGGGCQKKNEMMGMM